ncbi:bifunctional precorrin-2 dehydrogenase/sirohydrochlorin ferrochelatase [uncultured Brachyspira sp.]|uniref:precorrin-2 dehydrogenase/sirohydrochlorin ferrochelatase family protein n=1 Tax=uncultured Brachyspira sp. TaxID=221953 RepID=UPI002605E07B|nr:bifunctional precorrin-2 dehydrogenase/sirohydrochlorin ferrochelatase [uncultured Brachyspira sp.]
MFFPVFINIKNKECLIIGGGKVALRKINKLLEYECNNITVISDKALKDIIELNKSNKITLIESKFELNEKLLEKYFLVVAATNDEKINNEISNLCIAKNILINNASSKDNMNIRFCTNIENEEYSIGISANGNPKKALEIKEKIKTYLNI